MITRLHGYLYKHIPLPANHPILYIVPKQLKMTFSLPFRLLLMFLPFSLQTRSQLSPDIRLNKEGFYISAIKEAVLVGEVKAGKQDGCTYAFSEPETAYTDTNCSYASNEIAINWNAPLVYLLNAMEYLTSRTEIKKRAPQKLYPSVSMAKLEEPIPILYQ